VRERIRRLASIQPASRHFPPILIQGETGTGKGLVAGVIHGASRRAGGRFVDVDCAAIPEPLLEAELFGFERGAFTDARQGKAGLFQVAHGGTLFLDEIGTLPPVLQAKLLKVVEERAVRRLGSTQSEPVDVLIIAATNEDLPAALKQRRFREDLYHRLAGLTLTLPPLRDRGQDILLLADHFLSHGCTDYRVAPKTLSPDARTALLTYPWPGNVRELANMIERVVLLCPESIITAEQLGLPGEDTLDAEPSPGGRRSSPFKESLSSFERTQLLEALRDAGGNVALAWGVMCVRPVARIRSQTT